MKKNCSSDVYSSDRTVRRKLFLKMKLIVILICIIGLTGSYASVYSQQTKLDLSIQNTTVKDVLKMIEGQSEFSFMYNASKVDVLREVNLNIEDSSVEDILKKLFKDENVSYKIIGRNIIILPKDGESSQGQQLNSVSGTVTDSSGLSLPGVSIIIKGTTQGTITDFDGNFNLEDVPSDATLVFSFVGMKTMEIEVAGQTIFNITLEEDAIGIEEVVAIGYGTVKKRDLTGSVASVKGEEIARQSTVNVSQALQGSVPGVSVVNTSGAPGSGASLIIRGQGSFSNTPPLVVIDGMIGGDLNTIDPNDISSLEVLKDASSAAIYGSRAANGVIIVTTKRGESGRSKFNFQATYGIQSLARPLDMLTAQKWRDIEVWKYNNEGQELPVNLQSGNFDPSKSTDWQDELFRTAPQQKYNLSISGGNESSNYSFSMGYLDQEGIAIESHYERINVRMNSDFKRGKFTFSESFGVSHEDSRGGNITSIRTWPAPVFHAFDENGEYGSWSPGWGVRSPEFLITNNPVADREISDQTNKSLKLIGNVSASFEIIDGLTFKTNVGITWMARHRKSFVPVYNVGNVSSNSTADLTEWRDEDLNILLENTLSYTREIAKHSFSAVAGWTRQSTDFARLRVVAEKFPDGIFNADAAEEILPSSGGYEIKSSIESFLGRVNYSYADKYLLTASIRRDGSSRFREDLRWGNYPSFSLGWVLSEESFFPENNLVQYLKLRGGYGQLGSQNAVSEYQVQSVLALGGTNVDYPLGTPQQFTNGVSQVSLTNTGLLWEVSESMNIGLDANLLDNKFTFTADYFKKNTRDLQFGSPVPLHLGFGTRSSILVNAGDVQNKGFEAALTYHKRNGELTFDIGANVYTLKNEVLELNTEGDILVGGQYGISGQFANRTEVGRSLANFYLYETDGIFQSIEEVNAHSKDGELIQPLAQPGDLRFKDLNDDGTINANDKRYFSGNLPDFEFGINFSAKYKGFDLNLLMQGSVGNKIYNGVGRTLKDRLALNADHWREDNKGSDIFRPTIADVNLNAGRASDYFLEDASYLRVRNIQLGYSIPAHLLSKINVETARLTITGQNLITFTKFSGYDPENVSFGINRGANSSLYPLPKTVLVGLSIDF